MASFSKQELRRARRVKEEELYEKEGYKKAVILGRTLNDYENHLYMFLIDLNICLVPVYVWGVEFILILSGVISPSYFDLLFYLMFGLLFLTSCIMLPLYTARTGGYSWGGRLMGLRLVRPDRQPASAMRLVLRQLFGFGIPMMLFGYFFSVFGIVGWWLFDGLVSLLSPCERTLADWIFGTVFVYAPRYEMKVIRTSSASRQAAEEPEPKPAAAAVREPAAVPKADIDSDRSAQRQEASFSETQSDLFSQAKTADISDDLFSADAFREKEGRSKRSSLKSAMKKPQISAAVDASLAAAAASMEQEESRESSLLNQERVSLIDLHIRSNFSDDSNAEVEEIFREARDKKMEVISITDHNNARANAVAAHFSKLYEVAYIPGVEIDCQLYGERVRILGYYIDWNDPFFDQIERLSLRREKDVSQARIQAFEKLTGMKVNAEELLANSRFMIMPPQKLTDLVFDDPKGRQLQIVRKYLAESSSEAQARSRFLQDVFGPGGPCEIRVEYPGALKVIEAIHAAGGMAILSGWHLDRISNDVIEGLLDGGIDGFEVFTPNNSEKIKTFLLALVSDEKLFVTGGSDYHGTMKKECRLGYTSASPKGEQIISIFTRPILQGKSGFHDRTPS